MGNRFSSGKNSIAECDRCGFRYKLTQLRKEVVKGKTYDLLVCPTCYEPDHPQLLLGTFPVDDPQGVRDPRPDRTYFASGLLQGYPGQGSRGIQWGWNPVGGANGTAATLQTKNNLVSSTAVGNASISWTVVTPSPPVFTGTLLTADNGAYLVTQSGAYFILG